MKKTIFASTLFAVATSLALGDITVTGADQKDSGSNKGDIIFNTDGAKLTATAHLYGSNISVGENVEATITTGTGFAYYMSGNGTKATLSGVNKDNSTLNFDGYILGFGTSSSNLYDLDISNITFNMKRTHNANNDKNNLLRGKTIKISNSNIVIQKSPIEGSSQILATSLTLTNSKFDIQGDAFFSSNVSGEFLATGTSRITISKGAKFTFANSNGYLQLNSGSTLDISGYFSSSQKLRMSEGSKLILNVSNIDETTGYQDKWNTSQKLGTKAINIYGSAEVEINAQNNLSGFCVNNGEKTITLHFGDRGTADYLLALDYLNYNPNSTAYQAHNDILTDGVFYDLISFTNGDLVFKKETISEDILSKSLVNFKLDGQTHEFTYEEVTIDGTQYWAITTVPEPAQWATIFGAIAVAFVAYRRRK